MIDGDDVPEGWHRLHEVYRKGDRIVVLGFPDDDHNCDAMGCGSVGGHVVAWGTVTRG